MEDNTLMFWLVSLAHITNESAYGHHTAVSCVPNTSLSVVFITQSVSEFFEIKMSLSRNRFMFHFKTSPPWCDASSPSITLEHLRQQTELSIFLLLVITYCIVWMVGANSWADNSMVNIVAFGSKSHFTRPQWSSLRKNGCRPPRSFHWLKC